MYSLKKTTAPNIYTLSLHDALPISPSREWRRARGRTHAPCAPPGIRSEEHTSELQSHSELVCRLLLEKKKWMYCEITCHFVNSRIGRVVLQELCGCSSVLSSW